MWHAQWAKHALHTCHAGRPNILWLHLHGAHAWHHPHVPHLHGAHARHHAHWHRWPCKLLLPLLLLEELLLLLQLLR
jgi:hypothetical protein